MNTKERLNKIQGGVARGKSIEDIAKKHNVSVCVIKKQLKMGIEVEKEHTPDPKMAQEIAMDHLTEFPDYYTRLAKMEKEGEKALEAKESTTASSSGSYEAPFMSNQTDKTVILKKDIHNWKKQKEVGEATGAGVSAGAMYDAPPKGLGSKDPLKLDKPRTASISAAPATKMKATEKGFPKFGGPEGKFVEIDDRCKTYPYCNQGNDNQIKLREFKEIQAAIHDTSKKYGIPINEVARIVAEQLPKSWWDSPENKRAIKSWTQVQDDRPSILRTKEPIDMEITDDVDLAKFKLLFYKYNIDFEVEELK